MNILEKIVSVKRTRVNAAKEQIPLDTLKKKAPSLIRPGRDGFMKALWRTDDRMRVIAEIKKASPSAGVIREEFDPLDLAREYIDAGTDAISILTEEDFFQGSPLFMIDVREAFPETPLLRKDFIYDTYQIYESVCLGADAVLLIVSTLTPLTLHSLIKTAHLLDLAALVEVHNEKEVHAALKSGARIIGINNRDLKTFATDIRCSCRLVPKFPNRDDVIIISESGIKTPHHIRLLAESGVDAVLIGETFMRAPSPGKKLGELIYGKGKEEEEEE